MMSSRNQRGRSSSGSAVNATEAKQSAGVKDKAHLKRTLSTIEKDSLRYKKGLVKPWLDEDGNRIWSSARIGVAEVVMTQTFETVMGVVITANILLMVAETNADATCYPAYVDDFAQCPSRSTTIFWLQAVNVLLLVIYTVECCFRAFVERGNYVCNRWNQIDLVTVVLGWLGATLSVTAVNLNVLRIFRVVRLMRAARVVISVPEFYILVSGLTSSIKAILFGSVMLLSVILVWAIIAVELLHPVNVAITHSPTCERCPMGFQDVQSAGLTLFQQIVAGDSWGQISIPLAESAPWTIPILFFIVMTISLGVMNLILAVIVERATEARENDQQRKLAKKDSERERNMVELALLCDSMDNDGSGSLSLEEMLQGYDQNLQFNSLMELMDIRRSDMETIFNVLDSDSSGEVSYVEFCQQLGTCRKRDPVMMNSLIKYSIMELRKLVQTEVLAKLHEHTEALVSQQEMLSCQMDLLFSLPLDEGVKKAVAKKRSERVLRRQGKSQGKPQFFDEIPVAASIPATVGTALFPQYEEETLHAQSDEVISALAGSCQRFEEMHLQVESLLRKAEGLAFEASSRSGSRLGEGWSDRGSDGAGEGAEPEDGKVAKRFGSKALPLPDAELERRFAQILKNLDRRMCEEEAMQQRCKDVIQSVSTLMDSSGRYFYC